MGTDVHLVAVDADAGALAGARARLEEMERLWTRFAPESELSRLNAGAGGWVVVGEPTFALVERAIDAWWATAGRFDPTVLRALVASGYDRSFEQVASRTHGAVAAEGPPVPGCAGIELDRGRVAVRLPMGVALDLGGIAKGWAADLVSAELVEGGAAGACVNVGGDLRVRGSAPDEAGWSVAVDLGRGRTVDVGLDDGAVATTSSLRRRWDRAGEPCHHLIDPASGRPATSGLCQVSVVARECVEAEVLAKAAFVAGPAVGAALIEVSGAAAFCVERGGVAWSAGPFDEYVRG
jgi:thiamine biosynthesis lipoprotein